MDEPTIRRQFSEFKNRLARIHDEQQALQDIVKGYETLLRAMAEPDYQSSGPLDFPAPPGAPLNKPIVSMRSAVARILQDAAGSPVHSREILERAQAMGASTTAKQPVSVVDLIVLGLLNKKKVEKVAPRTWRWISVPEKPAE